MSSDYTFGELCVRCVGCLVFTAVISKGISPASVLCVYSSKLVEEVRC